jgi:hypothetical protein
MHNNPEKRAERDVGVRCDKEEDNAVEEAQQLG